MRVFSEYTYQFSEIEFRVKDYLSALPSGKEKKTILENVLGLLDMTTLEGSDNTSRIRSLCHDSRFSTLKPGLPDAAAVCVYPAMVRIAKRELSNTGIKVASVAGAFPSGQTALKIKLDEVKYAIDEGADEIDTVISRGKFLEGKYDEVYNEIAAIKNVCADVHLKVILETGELLTIENIRKASELSILAGADFIKTSTGKINVGATELAFLVMLDTIKEYLEKTGKSIGIKPAGGIRTVDQALAYYVLVNEILGPQWLNKKYFRIGASSLAKNILEVL